MDVPAPARSLAQAGQRVERAPLVVVLGWASGAIGASVLSNTFGVLLLRFLTDQIGIAASLAGLLIAISKFFDAFFDPIVGSISDELSGPMGRRRPFLLLSTLLCPLALISLFVVPHFTSHVLLVVWTFCALMLYSAAYALWSVPYMAMPAEITDDYHDRSRLMACRTAAGTLGTFLSASAGPWLLVYWGNSRSAHERVAILLSSFVALSCFVCFLMTRHARQFAKATASRTTTIAKFKAAWDSVPLRTLLSAKSLFFGLSATTASVNAYFTKYVLQTSDVWLGTYYILQSVGVLVSMPVWVWLGKRFEKRSCMLAGVALYGVTALSWAIAGPSDYQAFWFARVLASSFGLGGFVLFGQSMLPDTIEYEFLTTGVRREGVFAGMFVLVEKVSTAAGVALIGVLLGAFGYVAQPGLGSQSGSAVQGIRLCFSLLPALGSAGCIATMLHYRLTKSRLIALRSQ